MRAPHYSTTVAFTNTEIQINHMSLLKIGLKTIDNSQMLSSEYTLHEQWSGLFTDAPYKAGMCIRHT